MNSAATPAADTVITFNDVHMEFGEGDILRGVSFEAKQKETVILLGETGTGKTLLLKLAAGLIHPSQGNIQIFGQDISGMTERELLPFRSKIGFVFQEGALFDSLTVGENVAYRLSEDGLPEEEIDSRVREVLSFVELQHTMELLPSELSGGMRRRVAIARALINRPAIVLYDSPTAGLDPVTSQTIITLLLRLRDVYGVTALLATHRLQDGFALANFRFDFASKHVVPFNEGEQLDGAGEAPLTRFIVLRDGKIYWHGSPKEILASGDRYLKRFLI
jgi:phospholipid/cholesterol/gamma-HCH transport system ATP-binding protein